MSSGSGKTHLEKFAGHIHADKVVVTLIRVEKIADFSRRLWGDLFRSECGVQQYLWLVRFYR